MSGKNDKELDAKLMNFDGDRYDIVVLSSMWAKELKKKPEYKGHIRYPSGLSAGRAHRGR